MTVAVVATADVSGGAEKYLIALYSGLYGEVPATLVGRLPGWSETGLGRIEVRVGPKWSRRDIARSAGRAFGERSEMISAARWTQAPWTHLQYKREQVLLTRALARTSRVLWTEHGTLDNGRGAPALRAAYRRAAARVDAIVCVSPEVADSVRPAVPASTRLEVVVNPVDADRFRPPTPRQRQAARAAVLPPSWEHRTVAVVACRLHPAKRLERVLALCDRAGFALLVVGDGPDRARLDGLARGRDVHFLGHRSDVDAVLAAADLYVFSASVHGEGQPLAVLEAAAAGLPVVGFAGDTGNGLITALGGRVVEDEGVVVPAPEAGAGLAGREYVLARHSPRAWVAAYAELFSAPAAAGPGPAAPAASPPRPAMSLPDGGPT